eukprot:scaffold779_cov165-Amphora_coffeaeformis.AAC.2
MSARRPAGEEKVWLSHRNLASLVTYSINHGTERMRKKTASNEKNRNIRCGSRRDLSPFLVSFFTIPVLYIHFSSLLYSHNIIMADAVALIDLPDGILGSILDFLNLVDRQRLSTTCRALRLRGDDLKVLMKTVQVTSRSEVAVLEHLYFGHLTRLVHLDLASYATDDVLQQFRLADSQFQQLRSLSMVGSLGISDRGLEYLATGKSYAESIQSIDLTYCHNTTYAATFPLRDNFPNLRLLRRQPAWMDGSFETPFENDGLHTYYADGSFQFEREEQSCGYVMHIEPWNDENPYFVFDKLQYSNSDMPEFWPRWARFFYRPGVSLLRLSETQVLVGQTLRGLRPPRDFPRPEHASLLPQPKTSIHLNRQGDVAAEDDPERYYLISRMRVFPLASIMPPVELVERNRTFCRELKVEEGTFGMATEDLLHLSLGGE